MDIIEALNSIEDFKRKIKEDINDNLGCKHEEYNSMIDQLWLILFETTSVLLKSFLAYHRGMTKKEHTIFRMYENCLLDSHAAFQILRSGFDRAAAVIMRGIVENLSLAIAMKEDESEKIFNKYVNDDYDPKRAIGIAKKWFPELAKMNGRLSNVYVHEKYDVIGRSFRPNGEPLGIPNMGYYKFIPESALLTDLGFLIETLGQAVEWSFANKVKPSIFWELESDGILKIKTDYPAKRARIKLEQSKMRVQEHSTLK